MPVRNAKSIEKRIELLEGLLGAGHWTYDLQTREVSWSAGLYRLLGLNSNVVAASVTLYDSLVHPEDRLSHEDVVELAKSGDLALRRFRVIRPDGHLIWMESRTERQYNRDGSLVILHGIVQEVTETEKLRADHSRLVSSASSMRKITNAEFWRTDPEGRLLDLSGWIRFTGQTPEQMREFAFLSAIHPDDRELYRSAWQTGIARKERIDLSVRVRRHDGYYQQFRNAAVPVLDSHGQIVEWHGMSWMVEEAPSADTGLTTLQSAHVRAARAFLDISAQELAAIANVSFSTVRRLEADISTVKADSIDRIRAALEFRGIRFLPAPNGSVSVCLSPA